MDIQSAKFTDALHTSLEVVTDNGTISGIPVAYGNRHFDAVLKWADNGGVIADYVAPAPTPRTVVDFEEFMNLFTDDEQVAIAGAAQQSPPVKLWYDQAVALNSIDLTSPKLALGMAVLVGAGLITQDRSDVIVASSMPGEAAEVVDDATKAATFNTEMAKYQADVFAMQLKAYQEAVARLSQYRLADGRPEVTEQRDTGEVDEDQNPIMETVVVQTAIDPLDAQIEATVFNEGTEQYEDVMIDNPLIVADDAARAAAQAVIDATPQDVKDFD